MLFQLLFRLPINYLHKLIGINIIQLRIRAIFILLIIILLPRALLLLLPLFLRLHLRISLVHNRLMRQFQLIQYHLQLFDLRLPGRLHLLLLLDFQVRKVRRRRKCLDDGSDFFVFPDLIEEFCFVLNVQVFLEVLDMSELDFPDLYDGGGGLLEEFVEVDDGGDEVEVVLEVAGVHHVDLGLLDDSGGAVLGFCEVGVALLS